MPDKAPGKTDKLSDDHELVKQFLSLCFNPRSSAEHTQMVSLINSYDDIARRRYSYLVLTKGVLLSEETNEVRLLSARLGYKTQIRRVRLDYGGQPGGTAS